MNKTKQKKPLSTYTGSEATLTAVKEAIKSHPQLGPKYLAGFSPYHSAMTHKAWERQGYAVIKGSKAIKSYTFIEAEDENGNEKKMIRRNVNLFHSSQVQKITKQAVWPRKWPL